jgi:predicted RNA-binding protein associated with RNAse of E/G family
VTITVIKNDHCGREVWRYTGRVLARGTTWVQLEARFERAHDVITPYHIFRRGDRFVEWFFSDRWYNIFEMHDVDDDHLKGWYCNITRPALLAGDTIYADDLALDLFVAPDGTNTVLDEEEFAALSLDETTRAQAKRALQELQERVAARHPPFDAIPPRQPVESG